MYWAVNKCDTTMHLRPGTSLLWHDAIWKASRSTVDYRDAPSGTNAMQS